MSATPQDLERVQVQRIDRLLTRIENALQQEGRDTVAYGPDLNWAYWIAFPDGRMTLMTAPAYGPDKRVVKLCRAVPIISTCDVTRFVEGMGLAEMAAMADSLESWLRAPRFRRMREVIRDRTIELRNTAANDHLMLVEV